VGFKKVPEIETDASHKPISGQVSGTFLVLIVTNLGTRTASWHHDLLVS
jgi:hypothetical protein